MGKVLSSQTSPDKTVLSDANSTFVCGQDPEGTGRNYTRAPSKLQVSKLTFSVYLVFLMVSFDEDIAHAVGGDVMTSRVGIAFRLCREVAPSSTSQPSPRPGARDFCVVLFLCAPVELLNSAQACSLCVIIYVSLSSMSRSLCVHVHSCMRMQML